MTRAYEKETNELQACQFSRIKQFSVLARAFRWRNWVWSRKLEDRKSLIFPHFLLALSQRFCYSSRCSARLSQKSRAVPLFPQRKRGDNRATFRSIIIKMNRREQNQKRSPKTKAAYSTPILPNSNLRLPVHTAPPLAPGAGRPCVPRRMPATPRPVQNTAPALVCRVNVPVQFNPDFQLSFYVPIQL